MTRFLGSFHDRLYSLVSPSPSAIVSDTCLPVNTPGIGKCPLNMPSLLLYPIPNPLISPLPSLIPSLTIGVYTFLLATSFCQLMLELFQEELGAVPLLNNIDFVTL